MAPSHLLVGATSFLALLPLVGCQGQAAAPLDPKRVAFCATVLDAVKPSDPFCGPYLQAARKLKASQKPAPEPEKKRADPHGWHPLDTPGIYMRLPSLDEAPYGTIQIWCKERRCGDIYVQANLLNGQNVAVDWTNATGYGGLGQKVQLQLRMPEDKFLTFDITKLTMRL